MPSGWLQVIRGPRPPAARWPPAKKVPPGRSSSAAQGAQPRQSVSAPTPDRRRKPNDVRAAATKNADPSMPSRTPEAIAEATAEEVRRLEEAVGALGEESPHAKPLLVALKAARAKLNVPVSVQIEATAKFLERARKRLAKAEAELAKVAAQKDECVAEVEAAERRLERLRDSALVPMQHEPVEVALLQSRIDELIRERDSLRVVANPAHVEVVGCSGAEEMNMLRAAARESGGSRFNPLKQ